MDEERNQPTMIIPAGAEIAVNEHGQLSIRTPGNLVIQNSGVYSVIESGTGSVRIDPGVKVEAVSVKAADSCFVAGELTAWRVTARRITLEKGAQANIMLQESESIELDRNARLVGNFASEKELYLMLGRFSRQLRRLPEGIAVSERGAGAAVDAVRAVLPPDAVGPVREAEPFVAPDGEDEPEAGFRAERDELLTLVRVVIERELGRPGMTDGGRKPLGRLLELVRERDLEGLRSSSRYLLSQVEPRSDDLNRAARLLERLVAPG